MVRQRFRSIGGGIFFILVICATFYPIASAALFGKTLKENIDNREIIDRAPVVDVEPDTEVFDKPVISIAFDDGWESSYIEGLPILNEFEFKASFFIMSDFFSDLKYMSVAQATSLQQQGHHIGSHTISHANLLEISEEDVRYELMGSQKQLSKRFGAVKDFAAPYGSYNESTLEEIKKLYRSHRSVVSGINNFENYDQYQLKSPNIRSTTTLDEIQSWIDKVRGESGWLIITYHGIDDTQSEFSVTPDQLKKQLQLVKDSGITVATIERVIDDVEATYGQP
jgi:peptidoglycan/xylan/chitin deacetylase (PgdA/CDA1 family)